MVTSILDRSVQVLAAAVLGATVAGCSSPNASAPTTLPTTTVVQSTTTTAAATTTAPTAPTTAPTAPTTAAPVIPVAPQPSAEAAADSLVSSWASGNRAKALRVATSQAVATLFAVAYPGDLAGSRGCTSAFPPIICTYGPPGGGNSNDPIYQVYISQTGADWYVSSVLIES
jgi:hypothetical protein